MKHIEIKTYYGTINVYNSKLYDKVPIDGVYSNKYILEDDGHVMNTRILSCYNLITPYTSRLIVATANIRIGDAIGIIADGNDKIIDFDYLAMLHRASNAESFTVELDDIKFIVYFNYGRMQVDLQSENNAYTADLQPSKDILNSPKYIISTLGMLI